ncbi:hypothetical protein ACFYM2_11570 [Streptomyces sp. NPDC006711]|uniref:hypothetical protein n=1 Tax=Streptomyces sp. NPDC006711 TaxID=3364762 RepID=UPI0036ACFEA5
MREVSAGMTRAPPTPKQAKRQHGRAPVCLDGHEAAPARHGDRDRRQDRAGQAVMPTLDDGVGHSGERQPGRELPRYIEHGGAARGAPGQASASVRG